MVKNRLGCKRSGFWVGYGSPAIWNPDKWLPICLKPFETGQKYPDFEWSSFHMVGAFAIAKISRKYLKLLAYHSFKHHGFDNICSPSSLHRLVSHSNCSFSYNGVYSADLILSICDVIVSQKLWCIADLIFRVWLTGGGKGVICPLFRV